MAVQIQLRRGTASQWTSTNPTLAAGEIALETDTTKLKLGDGSTAWTSLAYAAFGDITGVDITAGDGLDITQSGTTSGNYTATLSADLKSNGGLVIESTELAVKLDASSITGTLAVADGGTGLTSVPMVGIISAANVTASRTVLGVTNIGSYTGQIETAANKTYTIDPGAATARTITGFYIKSASGTVTAALKVGTAVVKSASVTSSTGDQTSLANTSVSANGVLTLVCSSNSSALDVIFAVEYTE